MPVTYNSNLNFPSKPAVTTHKKFLPSITKDTPLVSLKTASDRLAAERGLELSVATIRTYCRTRKWVEGHHWVKPGRAYLINLSAVYELIASGSLIVR